MELFKKVIWSEGMFLRPQHFQQQDRYTDFILHQRSLAPSYYFWGFRQLSIDASALAIGLISLNYAEGIFPDGTTFSFPSQSEVPEPLEIKEGVVDQVVYLALPIKRLNSDEITFDDRDMSQARYKVTDSLIEDINSTKGEPAELQIANPRLRLLLAQDLTDSWVSLGVIKIVERKSDRQILLDDNYIPPLISRGASPLLTNYLNEVLGLVQQRADALGERISQPGRGGVSEVGDFLMLQLLNGVQPRVSHILENHGIPPEEVYKLMISLGGELATFAAENKRCETIPKYNHDDPILTFLPLMQMLRRYLSTVLERNAIEIELVEKAYGVRVGLVSDRELISSCQFVLAVHASVAPEIIKGNFPKQIKIGSVDKIRDLVNLQLPGILINQLPIAPRQIPYHTGTHYFEMDASSDMWKSFKASGTIAMHVAGDFPDLEIQCWAIRR